MPHPSAGRKPPRRSATGAHDLEKRCAVIPVRLRSLEGLPWARQELQSILDHTHDGLLGRKGHGNVMANLWFARAAHAFASDSAADTTLTTEQKQEFLHFAGQSLLPVCKRAVQELISQKGIDGIWMDDSGVLAGLVRKGRPNASLATPLRLNALWYSALEVTGMALRGLTPLGQAAGYRTGGAKDPTGDHFERLAGRFRRAFNKAYWCEDHQRICPPARRTEAYPDHGPIPDAEQLLLMLLPECPIPRTKQQGILAQVEALGCGPLGVWICPKDQPPVESILHRAWLAQALGNLADTDSQRKRALDAARPLESLRTLARASGVPAFYQDGKPLDDQPDPQVTQEVLGTLQQFLGP